MHVTPTSSVPCSAPLLGKTPRPSIARTGLFTATRSPDWIRKLDGQNPRWLLVWRCPSRCWARYRGAQVLMKQELERLAEEIQSPDVFEVVSKALA